MKLIKFPARLDKGLPENYLLGDERIKAVPDKNRLSDVQLKKIGMVESFRGAISN